MIDYIMDIKKNILKKRYIKNKVIFYQYQAWEFQKFLRLNNRKKRYLFRVTTSLFLPVKIQSDEFFRKKISY